MGLAVLPAQAEAPPDGSKPGRMVLVLDASGSMKESAGGGTTRIQAARTALNEVVDNLPDDQEVALRVYGSKVEFRDQPGACEDSRRVVDLGTDNRDALRSAIASYEPFGETPTGYALQEAGKDLGGEGQRTIVLVSDGEPTCDPDPCQVAQQLAQDGVDVRIDVVGLGVSGKARDTLRCVAERGNGTYYDAQDAGDIVDSLVESAARAARPFDFTGDPVQGTPTAADAPELTSGQYLDTMPTSGPILYRVRRTAPGSTVHVGITTRSTPDATAAAASVAIKRADDERQCSSASAFGVVLGMRNPVLFGGTSSWKATPDDPCNTVDELLVEVDSRSADVAGQPLEIAVYEEPPLADPLTTPTRTDPIEGGAWETLEPGDAQAATPGTSLASAPVISDGTWSADISPGEAQVFAVPVDWGQDVQFQLDTRLTKTAIDAAAVGSRLDLSTIGPVRDQGKVDYYAKEPSDWTSGALALADAGPYRTGARTPRIDWSNRLENSPTLRNASVPGLRYVQVAYNVRGDAANLPYTLTVRTNGTAGTGAPEYTEVEGLSAPTADSRLTIEPEPPEAEQDDSADSAESVEGTAVSWTWIGLGALAVVLLAAVGVVVIRIRRA